MANQDQSAAGKENGAQLVKTINPRYPDLDFYLLADDAETLKRLAEAPVFAEGCAKACTNVLTMIPRTLLNSRNGIGSGKYNVDGYRTINAYVISDPLFSSSQRGFTLELSFAIAPGAGKETTAVYNFDSYFNPVPYNQPLLHCGTSDLLTTGGLPWIGGFDLVHILRAPVMGPYVSAVVINQDTAAHNVEVQAYLST